MSMTCLFISMQFQSENKSLNIKGVSSRQLLISLEIDSKSKKMRDLYRELRRSNTKLLSKQIVKEVDAIELRQSICCTSDEIDDHPRTARECLARMFLDREVPPVETENVKPNPIIETEKSKTSQVPGGAPSEEVLQTIEGKPPFEESHFRAQ
ncbi:hypothetical protein MMC12_003742 [Toensbergia leucococca]|nr:hypothetical protein [Toensbergia leucococca]